MQNLTASGFTGGANISTWLGLMGLGGLTTIDTFTFLVDHSPFEIPTKVAPVFFSSLTQTNNTYLDECANCTASLTVPPATPSLTALPGLAQNYRDTFGTLSILNTAFQNMSTFQSTVCPPANLVIANNPSLQTLDGLSFLATPGGTGSNLLVINNKNLTNPADFAALEVFAGCANSANFTSSITVQNTVCGNITSWPTFCAFVNTGSSSGTCPLSPPPPAPVRPPPPPFPPPPNPPPPPAVCASPFPLNTTSAGGALSKYHHLCLYSASPLNVR